MCDLRIAIVDDDAEIREMLQSIFDDWKTDTAFNGTMEIIEFDCVDSAYKYITENVWSPHICCVDYRFKKGNGLDLAKQIKGVLTDRVNIFLITAWKKMLNEEEIAPFAKILDKTHYESVENEIICELNELNSVAMCMNYGRC